jgi:hypothetical protein
MIGMSATSAGMTRDNSPPAFITFTLQLLQNRKIRQTRIGQAKNNNGISLSASNPQLIGRNTMGRIVFAVLIACVIAFPFNRRGGDQ